MCAKYIAHSYNMSTKEIEQMSNISERLIEERKKLGLNQDKMADIARVSKRAYCNYESGEREPMAGFFANIAAAGADVNYILTGVRVGNVPEIDPLDRMILDVVSGMDKKQKELVKLVLESQKQEQKKVAA